MNAVIGNYALAAAALAAAIAILAAVAAARFSSHNWLNAARAMIVAIVVSLGVAAGCLLMALVHGDFSLEYVAQFTDKQLPLNYKLAAFWAGQEGSVLLWAILLGAMSLLVVITRRKDEIVNQAAVIGALVAIASFFIGLMLFVPDANPFRLGQLVPADGHGLNPPLQNPWMISHPPMLFLGYATFAVPFAFVFASLATGRRDGLWVNQARRWVMAAWLFLGIGIILGSVWAYVALGWGGYWGWDPVENASLIPWMVATALVHSLLAQQQRGMFKRWTAALASLTFLLCIFAAWVTRSGLIKSQHAFEEPSVIGQVLMWFMIIVAVVMLALMLWRAGRMKSDYSIPALFSRETAVMCANILLLVMAAITLWGTARPAFAMIFGAQAPTAAKEYYNATVLPLALGLAAVMAISPLLSYGVGGMQKVGLKLVPAGLASAIAVIGVLAIGVTSAWALIAAAVIGLTVGGILTDMVISLAARVREGENPILATFRMLDANHRRYGGWLVHLGIASIIAGVAGSGLCGVEAHKLLGPGESATVARYTVKFEAAEDIHKDNYTALGATLSLTDDAGHRTVVQPQARFFTRGKRSEYLPIIALNTTWRDGLHVYFTEPQPDRDGRLMLNFTFSPLLMWLWVGALLVCGGGVVCLVPSILTRREVATLVEAPQVQAAPQRDFRPALG